MWLRVALWLTPVVAAAERLKVKCVISPECGHAYTAQTRYHRYVCKDCGKWSRTTQHAKSVHVVSVAE